MLNHQHIYSTLRSALFDRDRDLTGINYVIVHIGPDQFAIKENVPSGALLMAYTILFNQNFLSVADNNSGWMAPAARWLGGDTNASYPLFSNEVIAGIAIAVAVYAGFIIAVPDPAGILIRPNFASPMVKRTLELIRENNLGISNARDLFIELMQIEEYATHIKVADDFIANPFIASITIGSTEVSE